MKYGVCYIEIKVNDGGVVPIPGSYAKARDCAHNGRIMIVHGFSEGDLVITSVPTTWEISDGGYRTVLFPGTIATFNSDDTITVEDA